MIPAIVRRIAFIGELLGVAIGYLLCRLDETTDQAEQARGLERLP